MTAKWIDGSERGNEVGQVGFLIRKSNPVKRFESFELRDTPPKKNQSFEPVLRGWCGSYNDLNTYGEGLWRVARVAKNGRAMLVELEGDELADALDELGFPELMPKGEARQVYLVEEVQDINSSRTPERIRAEDLSEAKSKATRMQMFRGTVLKVRAENGALLSMKRDGEWIDD